MEITYVAIERHRNPLLSHEASDRYAEFARVFVGQRDIASLYPPRPGYDNGNVHVIFTTVEPDFSDPAKPVHSENVSFFVTPQTLTDVLSGLAKLLPPF